MDSFAAWVNKVQIAKAGSAATTLRHKAAMMLSPLLSHIFWSESPVPIPKTTYEIFLEKLQEPYVMRTWNYYLFIFGYYLLFTVAMGSLYMIVCHNKVLRAKFWEGFYALALLI